MTGEVTEMSVTVFSHSGDVSHQCSGAPHYGWACIARILVDWFETLVANPSEITSLRIRPRGSKQRSLPSNLMAAQAREPRVSIGRGYGHLR
jgi:hypothetical protein